MAHGVLFFPLYQSLGAPGLQAFKYAMGLATFWLIYAAARLRGGSGLAAGLLLVMLAGGFRFRLGPTVPLAPNGIPNGRLHITVVWFHQA